MLAPRQINGMITSLLVLVHGGTGVQGAPLVRELLHRGHRPVVLTRNPDATRLPEGVRAVEGDLTDPDSLRAAYAGVDAVALLVPAMLPHGVDRQRLGENAIVAAETAGVSRIVWNASGPIPARPTGDAVADARLPVLARLARSPVPYVVLEPQTYLENLLAPWTAPGIAQRDELVNAIPADRRTGWISVDDLAVLQVAALEASPVLEPRCPIAYPDPPTGAELAALFSRALGRSIRYREVTPGALGEAVGQVYGPFAGKAIAAIYHRELEAPTAPPSAETSRRTLAQLQRTLTPIEEWIRAHAAAFTAVAS
jgi:uncharacterized protein YbjT (DUF2867 family)